MAFVPGRTFLRFLPMLGIAAMLSMLASCDVAPPEESESTQPEGTVSGDAAEADSVADVPRARPFLPVAMARSTRIASFRHNPHAEIRCAECHQNPPGHGGHAELDCKQCHRNGLMLDREDLTKQDCLNCHHGQQDGLACTECHETVAPRVVDRTIEMAVWGGSRTKRLPFDHAVHEEPCATCHTESVEQTPERTCTSCHEYHHRPAADCVTCHGSELLDRHDLSAHEGCVASGCHADEAVNAMSLNRVVCVTCHQAQIEHRPGRECAECHQVRKGDSALVQGPVAAKDPFQGSVGGLR